MSEAAAAALVEVGRRVVEASGLPAAALLHPLLLLLLLLLLHPLPCSCLTLNSNDYHCALNITTLGSSRRVLTADAQLTCDDEGSS